MRLEENEEDQFFDSREDLSSVFDSSPSSPSAYSSCVEENSEELISSDPLYQIWMKSPESVLDRRNKFMRLMGWDQIDSVAALSIDRITSDGSTIVGSSENGSSIPSWSSEGTTTRSTPENSPSEETFAIRIKDLDDANATTTDEPSYKSFGSFAFVKQLMQREHAGSSSSNSEKSTRRRMGWLRRLGAVACIVDRQSDEIDSVPSNSDPSDGFKIRRVSVRPYRKTLKEFSAVFSSQDIKAHDGAILTMKFSLDGQYLASGGEDGVVRVWRVMVCKRMDCGDLPDNDPPCLYFTVNSNSELAPLYADKEKKVKRRNSDSACVVVPSDVFRIHEKPLHEFRGHHGDVLDLSWSNDKQHLLSSSTDETARLWCIGCDSCLKVFLHSNYVTSVQFNPVDENYFISGSIDGKVRTWGIQRSRVLDWIDVREIVTAVCYRPDGKGVVVGTITGDCRFYDVSDKHLLLEAEVSLHGKKSHNKMITGIQFCPSDHRKLMVTSADSKVRILDGVDVVCKYKGLRTTGGQISASFTSDGRHIVSASEDSNVYLWTHTNHDAPTSPHLKSTWSSERFPSSTASVAIPWNGPGWSENPVIRGETVISPNDANLCDLSRSGSFTLSQEFFPEFPSKCSTATWPEEKLPTRPPAMASLCKSDYMFLKASCQDATSAWGSVIVTAGWDGRIRSFRNYGLPVQL